MTLGLVTLGFGLRAILGRTIGSIAICGTLHRIGRPYCIFWTTERQIGYYWKLMRITNMFCPITGELSASSFCLAKNS